MDPRDLSARLADIGQQLVTLAQQIQPPAPPPPQPAHLPQLISVQDLLALIHAGNPGLQLLPTLPADANLRVTATATPQVSATTPQFSPATPQVSSPVAADIEEGEVLPQGASMSRETLLEWLKSSIDWLTLGDRTPARETALAAANRLHELAVWPDADVAGIEKMARKYNLIDDALGGPPPPPPGTPPSPAEAAKEGMRVMHIQQRRAEAANPTLRRLNESHGLGGWGSENNVLRTLITEKGGTGGDLPKSG